MLSTQQCFLLAGSTDLGNAPILILEGVQGAEAAGLGRLQAEGGCIKLTVCLLNMARF